MQNKYWIIDGHLDLSMNAMEWNRDLRMNLEEINHREDGMRDKPDRGKATVSFPAMQAGAINMCFATLIARYAKPSHPLGGWRSPEQAWSMVMAQNTWYQTMVADGWLYPITDQKSLEDHVKRIEISDTHNPIGYVLTLEGADSILSWDHLDRLYQAGLRAIGPAHYGPGTYAFGTNSVGGLGVRGKELLKHMEARGIVLDVTHLCDTSFWEAMDHFHGSIWASHSNCRALVNHNRQFSDEQINILLERDAVIGLPLDAWMMVPNWVRGQSTPDNTSVTLSHLIDHLDHICQLAGHCEQVALGTDLDGGFGREQCPSDLVEINDLQKLHELLLVRGYQEEQVKAIFHGNWLRKLKESLPEGD